LEGGPLLEQWWTEASKTVIPYLNITARFEGPPDQDLLKVKGGRGFPYCTLMDAKGEVIWEVRPSGKDAFAKGVKGATALAKYQAALAKDPENKALKANVGILDFMGRSQREKGSTVADLEELAKAEGVDAEILKEFSSIKKSEQIMGALRNQRRDGGKALLDLARKGVAPDDDDDMATQFWVTVTQAAVNAKDKALATKAVDKFIASAKGKPFEERAAEFGADLKKKIAAILDDDKAKDDDKKKDGDK
jgi:hypothetical protein